MRSPAIYESFWYLRIMKEYEIVSEKSKWATRWSLTSASKPLILISLIYNRKKYSMGIHGILVWLNEICSPVSHLLTKRHWVTNRQSSLNMILIRILKCSCSLEDLEANICKNWYTTHSNILCKYHYWVDMVWVSIHTHNPPEATAILATQMAPESLLPPVSSLGTRSLSQSVLNVPVTHRLNHGSRLSAKLL